MVAAGRPFAPHTAYFTFYTFAFYHLPLPMVHTVVCTHCLLLNTRYACGFAFRLDVAAAFVAAASSGVCLGTLLPARRVRRAPRALPFAGLTCRLRATVQPLTAWPCCAHRVRYTPFAYLPSRARCYLLLLSVPPFILVYTLNTTRGPMPLHTCLTRLRTDGSLRRTDCTTPRVCCGVVCARGTCVANAWMVDYLPLRALLPAVLLLQSTAANRCRARGAITTS